MEGEATRRRGIMRYIFPALPIAALALSLAAGTSIGRGEGKDGPLFESGFEMKSSIQKSPAGWSRTIVPRFEEHVEFIWDEEIPHGGERSVSIEIGEDHPAEMTVAYNWYADILNFLPGGEYELTCWIRGRDLEEPAWVCVQCWDETMSKMIGFETTQKDYPLTGTFEWKKAGTVFKVPEGTFKVVIRAGIAAPGNNGGRAWFDDLKIRALPEEGR